MRGARTMSARETSDHGRGRSVTSIFGGACRGNFFIPPTLIHPLEGGGKAVFSRERG